MRGEERSAEGIGQHRESKREKERWRCRCRMQNADIFASSRGLRKSTRRTLALLYCYMRYCARVNGHQNAPHAAICIIVPRHNIHHLRFSQKPSDWTRCKCTNENPHTPSHLDHPRQLYHLPAGQLATTCLYCLHHLLQLHFQLISI
jgi:hypothetical protein